MRILIIGFLAFSIWSAISTYIYVCKIKGLCDEPIAMQMNAANVNEAVVNDAPSKPLPKKLNVVPENMVIYFAFDKSEFKSNSKTDKYYNESNAFLDQNPEAKLSITGHTDAIGTDKYNWALGYRRAQIVQQYYLGKGMPANRIVIESEGEKEPADENSSISGRANNRRSVITYTK